jgi:pimeloyl-ACP methyl ester carboxylesterase
MTISLGGGRAQLPVVNLEHSPLAGGPAHIHYRECGAGVPLVFLHGGWGYDIYPLARQSAALHGLRLIIPDRSGYGRSTRPARFAADFHHRAAQETLAMLDALQIERCILWGHSDGAVISALLGLARPERWLGLVLEAFHYDRAKPASRKFFTDMATAPDTMGERVAAVLAREHGEDYWRDLLRSEGQAWLDIARAAATGTPDLFDGRLSQLNVPTVFIHGATDPRTEPGELAAVQRELPAAHMHVIANGGHFPHAESAAADEFRRELRLALRAWGVPAQ